jgi:membrane protein implicated in regulation of membrane protease activity
LRNRGWEQRTYFLIAGAVLALLALGATALQAWFGISSRLALGVAGIAIVAVAAIASVAAAVLLSRKPHA